ncbi:PREDICTED: uncharacterized protein LOC107337124 [Acropora digitifera]|uniref:uncharacterized protein LOC107337124 n=1 Tax=Acropora digitifera TaxID=70779 RepID=UPI00077ABC5A|nr:PREDICTED: uncharacterized protein LOC107337124 [Acropora digitifera]
MSFPRHTNRREETALVCSNSLLFILGLIIVLTGVLLVIVGAVRLHSGEKNCSASTTSIKKGTASKLTRTSCDFSTEAVRVGLPALLEELQNTYFEHHPHNIAWKPDLRGGEVEEYVKERYVPYNPNPESLKRRTDAAFALLDKLQKLQVNFTYLRAREGKALSQAKHFLQHVFGSPYDVNYYAGDWMMGPNYFCWQPICYVSYGINAFAWSVKPRTYADVQHVIDKIMAHKQTLERYRDNIALGVQAGMVRSSIDCKAGLDAFKEKYPMVATRNSSTGVLEEWYTQQYLKRSYLAKLEREVNASWRQQHGGQSVREAIKEALLKGIGEPLINLIHYLEFTHSRHCVPNDVASGLANLPVDFVYTDGVPGKRTTKILPGTNRKLSGKETYRRILSYFTTTDITPEEVHENGTSLLDSLLMPLVRNLLALSSLLVSFFISIFIQEWRRIDVAGLIEHFRDKCGGVPRWLDKETSYIAFQEGWALYAESPLLSYDSDLYENNFLQRFGMLKWQVWRAVRLVVDTGLHYKGMTRTEALKYFEDYTWDNTDFAVKEVTRYQSNPGQATAYMLGKLALDKMRQKVEKALGNRFTLRDFHYQLLSQGSAPLDYLDSHIDKYIDCVTGKLRGEACSDILRHSDEDEDYTDAPLMDFQHEENNPPPRPTQKYIKDKINQSNAALVTTPSPPQAVTKPGPATTPAPPQKPVTPPLAPTQQIPPTQPPKATVAPPAPPQNQPAPSTIPVSTSPPQVVWGPPAPPPVSSPGPAPFGFSIQSTLEAPGTVIGNNGHVDIQVRESTGYLLQL